MLYHFARQARTWLQVALSRLLARGPRSVRSFRHCRCGAQAPDTPALDELPGEKRGYSQRQVSGAFQERDRQCRIRVQAKQAAEEDIRALLYAERVRYDE